MFYWTAHTFLRILRFFCFPMKVYGREHIPSRENYIIASNHQSNLDPVLLGISILNRALNYFAKDSLFKNRVLGTLIRWGGAFPVKRGKGDVWALKEAVRRLKSKGPLVMFPEGTRKRGDDEQEAYPGIGFLATKAGVPIVPAYIDGSDKVMPPGVKWPRRHLITITYGAPLYFSPGTDYDQIAREVMRHIRDIPRFAVSG